MKLVDVENWNRKDHFQYFSQLDYPHFNICANLDITKYYHYIKEKEIPFFISLLYFATKAANEVKEFRYRIREMDGKYRVVEHEVVSPSFTILTEGDVFSFCGARFDEDFHSFRKNAEQEMENVKQHASVEDEPGRDDVLYVTSLPWVSFTSITHPIHMKPVDSIPRLSWGKYFEENGKIQLPFSVQVHHGLVDGVHVGRYFQIIQEMLDNLE